MSTIHEKRLKNLEKARAAKAAKAKQRKESKVIKEYKIEDEILISPAKPARPRGRPRAPPRPKPPVNPKRAAAGRKGAQIRWARYRERQAANKAEFNEAFDVAKALKEVPGLKVPVSEPPEPIKISKASSREMIEFKEEPKAGAMIVKQTLSFMDENNKMNEAMIQCLNHLIDKAPEYDVDKCTKLASECYERMADIFKILPDIYSVIEGLGPAEKAVVVASVKDLAKHTHKFASLIASRMLE